MHFNVHFDSEMDISLSLSGCSGLAAEYWTREFNS